MSKYVYQSMNQNVSLGGILQFEIVEMTNVGAFKVWKVRGDMPFMPSSQLSPNHGD